MRVASKINLSNVVVMTSLGAPHAAEEALRSDCASAVVATGFIYVIGPLEGAQKVGPTTDPKGRLATLQTGCPHELVLHVALRVPFEEAHEVEGRAHRLLARCCARNDWFDTTPAAAMSAVLTAAKPSPERVLPCQAELAEALPIFSFQRVGGLSSTAPEAARPPFWQLCWAMLGMQ